MKKEFSPVHLKHYHQNKNTHLTANNYSREDGCWVAHLVARMQHEEEGFSCAIERLTRPEGVGKEGPKYLTKKEQHQNHW